MKKLAILTLCAGLLYSCTVYEMPSSSSSKAVESSSSAGGSAKYCIYEERCYETSLTTCAVGKFSDFCPYSSSSSN